MGSPELWDADVGAGITVGSLGGLGELLQVPKAIRGVLVLLYLKSLITLGYNRG